MAQKLLLTSLILFSFLWLQGQETQIDSNRVYKRILREQRFTNWNFRLSPYGWLISISGRVETPDLPPMPVQLPEPPPPYFDFDLSFQEIRPALKFVMVLTGEYRVNRFVMGFTWNSLIIDGQAITPGDVVFKDNRFNLDFHGGDILAGYRLWINQYFNLDLTGGVRLFYIGGGVSTKLLGKTPLAYQVSDFYLDPIIGFRFKYIPHYRVEMVAWGDVGPFRTGSDLSFQLTGLLNILITKHFFIAPGYRIEGLRFKEGPYTDFNLFGLYFRIGVQF